MAFIHIWMEHNIKENGKRINNTEREEKPGLMEQCMKEIMSQEKSMEWVNFNGQMVRFIRDNSSIIILKGQENINGQMEELITENGKIIKCMEEVCLPGQMEGNMKENTQKIKNKAKEHFIGLMEENILDNGLMANSTEEEHLQQLMANKERVNGIWVKEQDGQMNNEFFLLFKDLLIAILLIQ